MLRVRGHGAGSDYDYSLRPVRAGAYGNFEWTAYGCRPRRSSPIAEDLLRIGRAIHLADRLVRRSPSITRHLRRLHLDIEVREPERWRRVSSLLEQLLEFATGGDSWGLAFHEGRGEAVLDTNNREELAFQPTTIALFSGGLDSLCGAADQASRSGPRPLFVTHSPPGRAAIEGLIGDTFRAFGRAPDKFTCVSYRLEMREAARSGVRSMFQEPTRRTRPFFYLSLACASALAYEVPRIQMSENGALALSLPYRSDVFGPSMARQAHAFLLAGFEMLLQTMAPGVDWTVTNPFVNETKGEACLRLGPAATLAVRSASCEYLGRQRAVILSWKQRHPKRAKVLGVGPQCGLCVPCLVRRAALKRAGIADDDANYFSAAPRVLREIRRQDSAVSVFGDHPPPLMNMLAPNPLFMERFCLRVADMGFAEFVMQYLPELCANRQLAAAPHMDLRKCYALTQRYAREMLAFLHG